jgi:two-component system sensor histidine kinase PilS (NtrC family)
MANKPAILTRPTLAPTDPQNVTLFRIYVSYRSLLSIVLMLSQIDPDTRQLLGILNPDLYLYVATAFLATNLILLGLIRTNYVTQQANLFLVFFVDILVITVLADTSGGMASGLPILLVVTAAASSVLLTNSTNATLIAALCVIALLADSLRLINEQLLDVNNLIPAGLLGILIFSVSILIQMVTRRVKRAEELARKRAGDLYNLQRLNEQIVQHLQTGILMVYANGSVRVMNQAATRLLDPQRPVPLEQGRRLADYHPQLAEQFERWQTLATHLPSPLQIAEDAPQIVANFRALQNTEYGAGNSDSLVFLEDYTPVTQQAQSLKLASLGRLTASIAHEIRNPLGAVSHAAQLMGESEELSGEDRALAEIIEHHTQRINALIENVMQISRRQAPKPQQLALKGWLGDFVGEYAAALTDNPVIELVLPEEPLEIVFDPEHLQRILSNLLDNGLRHSRIAHGQASAEIHANWDHLAGRCLIEVVDHGSGVAASEQAKLFEPFYTTVEKGTGLGLYLCRELCEINNATLNYRPDDQGRSCFRIAILYRG